MSETGILEAIWIKRSRGGPMDAQEKAQLVAGRGLVGNAHQGGKRQVTIIQRETWSAATNQLEVALDPAARRANLMVSAIQLRATRGHILRVGECRIRIHGETKPCERMDEACPGLLAALLPNWGGGAYGEVLDDGEIAVGDTVEWIEGAN